MPPTINAASTTLPALWMSTPTPLIDSSHSCYLVAGTWASVSPPPDCKSFLLEAVRLFIYPTPTWINQTLLNTHHHMASTAPLHFMMLFWDTSAVMRHFFHCIFGPRYLLLLFKWSLIDSTSTKQLTKQLFALASPIQYCSVVLSS